MLFNPAHTVLNQQASARKNSSGDESDVDTTNLIGHWDPNVSDSYAGSGTTYNNLVTSKTLIFSLALGIFQKPSYFFLISLTDLQP